MQGKEQKVQRKNWVFMAHNKRSVSQSIKAWRALERALNDLDSFEACAKWVIDNPQISKKLSGAGLMAVMAEDLKKKKH
jgi:hypothetical protein